MSAAGRFVHDAVMNWPAPTVEPLPAPPPMPGEPPDPIGHQPSELRRLLRAVAPATWVALLGATLVLVAAGIVVAGSWSSAGPAIRFAALVVASAVLAWGAERLRTLVPTSAGVIAHVAAFLVAPAGIAGASLLGATWPLCLLVGGSAAVAATELQARRWGRMTLHAGQVAALAIAATGLAALSGTTAGLVGGVVAVGLTAIGAHRRAAALAILAVLSPVLWALADAGIGAGTFERAGLVGERLGWSGPVVGVLAAVVLAITARRYVTNVLMLAATTAPVVGVVTGLAAIDGPAQLWWTVPGLLVIAGEAAWWLLPSDRHRDAFRSAVDIPAIGVAAAGTCAPGLLALAGWIDGSRPGFAVPALVTASALALVVLRRRRSERFGTDLAVAAIAACVLAAAIALDTPVELVAVFAVALVAAAAFASRRFAPVAVYVPAAWALVSIAQLTERGDTAAAIGLTSLGLLAVLLVAVRARLAAEREPLGWFEMGAVAFSVASSAAALVDGYAGATTLVVVALVGALVVLVERRFHVWACALSAAAGAIITSAAATQGGFDATLWIGWAAIAVGLVIVGHTSRSRIPMHAAAAAGVITLVVAAAGATWSAEQLLGATAVAAVVVSGLAITVGRRTPLDAAAATAGLAVATLSAFVDPVWVSFSWFVVGAQVASFGFAARRQEVQLIGSIVAVAAAVSAWFTSGANNWLVDIVEPAGVTAGDLWMAVATMTAFAAGVAARRTMPVGSWVAYSGGMAIAGIWLTSVQLDRETVWAVPLALTIGMVAAGIGAWRRLAAPLVGGVAVIGSTLLLAVGDDLTDVPTWAWLAVGGLALLGVAVLIERASRHGSSGLAGIVDRWQ